MEPYILRVTARDDPEKAVSCDAAVECAKRLFTEICRNIVKAEFRLQGEPPEDLYTYITVDGNSSMATDARRFLDETLDYLGGTARGTWMVDTYPDIIGRKRVARLVLELVDSLEGNALLHGYEGSERMFIEVDTIWVTGFASAVTRAYNGGLMGVVTKDPRRRDHWALTNGTGFVPMSFVSSISSWDVEEFASAGPVIATGTIVRDEGGALVELRAVENCYTFPGAVFLRGIAKGTNLGLVYPLEGIPGYYKRTGTWYLKCEDLGIEASAKSWDDCVTEFHRMFVSLWHAHADGTAERNDRIHSLLNQMCPFQV